MISDQSGPHHVESEGGGGHRGARRERCARASSGERGTALSDRVGGPPPSVHARIRPLDAVQSWTTGLSSSRKPAKRRSIWGMSVEAVKWRLSQTAQEVPRWIEGAF